MRPVFLPVLDANMTHGIIRAWFKAEGEEVHAGEALFEVETDKVNAEVEAEESGIVRAILVPVGEQVPILQLIAFIGNAEEPLPPPQSWSDFHPHPEDGSRVDAAGSAHPPAAEAVASIAAGAAQPTASPAARRLAREKGIALLGIRGSGGRGEITTADVLRALAAPPTAIPETPAASGRLDDAFVAALRRDVTAFRQLSSTLKVQLYREHGALIGEHVRIDAGAVIIAQAIRIGAGASIAADCDIDCQRFAIGRLAALGKRTRIRCQALTIGDALWGKDDVVIGGGGSDQSDARFQAGDACFIGEGAYLNPSHPLVLGDEVAVGSRAMLFTHSHWQSVLRGYPSLFGPIHVGNHVFIGNQSFVFPGVSIGDGATVMVNSFVAVNVAPGVLVGGVPAQVLRHITPPPREEQMRLVEERLLPGLDQVLRQGGYSLQTRQSSGTTIVDVGENRAVQFLPRWEPSRLAAARRIVALSFLDGAVPQAAAGLTVLDLASSTLSGEQDLLSDEVRECLRRRGIRFRPYAWRYRVGHCEGERLIRHEYAVKGS